MIVSGHQPAYLPWLGYFHKMSLCDSYVFMDTVQFLSRDFNHRNKIRTADGWMWLTVPVSGKSHGRPLNEVEISSTPAPLSPGGWQQQHWKSIERCYAKAPFFRMYADEFRELLLGQVWESLCDLCWSQLMMFRKWLDLESVPIVRLSTLEVGGAKDALVLNYVLKLGGDAVVFGEQGQDYVSLERFSASNIKVYFQQYRHPLYKQRFEGFESHMSVLDLLFCVGGDARGVLESGNVTKEELMGGGFWK